MNSSIRSRGKPCMTEILPYGWIYYGWIRKSAHLRCRVVAGVCYLVPVLDRTRDVNLEFQTILDLVLPRLAGMARSTSSSQVCPQTAVCCVDFNCNILQTTCSSGLTVWLQYYGKTMDYGWCGFKIITWQISNRETVQLLAL